MSTATAHDHLWDAFKASPIICWMAAKLGGMTVSDWASFAALVYTLILIGEKVGLWRWIRRRLAKVRRDA